MKNKDQILLEKLYLKTKNMLFEQNDNIFRSSVKLEIDLDYNNEKSYSEVNAQDQINVNYEISVEYRSYGIKGIDIYFVSAENFNIDIINYDDEDNEQVVSKTIDITSLKNIETEFTMSQHRGVYPTSFVVKLNKDFEPYQATLKF